MSKDQWTIVAIAAIILLFEFYASNKHINDVLIDVIKEMFSRPQGTGNG